MFCWIYCCWKLCMFCCWILKIQWHLCGWMLFAVSGWIHVESSEESVRSLCSVCSCLQRRKGHVRVNTKYRTDIKQVSLSIDLLWAIFCLCNIQGSVNIKDMLLSDRHALMHIYHPFLQKASLFTVMFF